MDRRTVFRFKCGSHLYGLNTPTSDLDYMEVFLPSAKDVLGLRVVEVLDESTKSSAENRRNTVDDVDDKLYTLQAYCNLLLGNNPNILETMFVPSTITEVRDPMMEELLMHPEKVVCKKLYKTFKGYAKSQEHKLTEKRARFTELCRAVEYLEANYAGEVTDPAAKMSTFLAAELNKSLKHYKGSKHNVESFHEGLPMKMVYEKFVSERDTYGWRVRTTTFETLGYDTKFGSHLLRLYYEAEELLLTGKLSFPFWGEVYEKVMAVKKGEVPLDDLFAQCETMAKRVEVALERSTLPEKPDFDFVDSFVVNSLLTHFREGR